MKNTISDASLSQFSELVATQMGLYFPRERYRDLEREAGHAAGDFGFEDSESCIQWLLASPLTKSRIKVLASHLTVGETHFFRDRNLFEVLERHILPELIQRRQAERRLRIWSAGCSTGEEPYSIAILLSKFANDLKGWNISIMATDINPLSLRVASKGVYGEWSFRDTPEWIKQGYFKSTQEGRYKIHRHIKKMVKFSGWFSIRHYD